MRHRHKVGPPSARLIKALDHAALQAVDGVDATRLLSALRMRTIADKLPSWRNDPSYHWADEVKRRRGKP